MKKVKEKNDSVLVERMNIRRFLLPLKGRTSLLSHRMSEDIKQGIRVKQAKTGKATGSKPARNPQQEFEDAQYKLNGKTAYPGNAFKESFINTSPFLDKKFTKVYLRGLINIEETIIPLEYDTVSLHESNARHGLTYRAEIINWRCKLPISYNAAITNPEQITQIFEATGFHVGVGSWRPARNGSYGMFSVGK